MANKYGGYTATKANALLDTLVAVTLAAGLNGAVVLNQTLQVGGTVTLLGDLVADVILARTSQDFRITNVGGTAMLTLSQTTGNATVVGSGIFGGVEVGRGHGYSATNIVVGPNALQNAVPGVSTGVNLIAMGSNALLYATTAFNSIAIGNSALQTATTANHCYAFGHVALVAVTTADHALAFGSVCMQNLTTGVENHSFGIHGFDALTTGNYNTGIGMGHGYLLQTGDNNVMVGRQAGELSTAASNLLLLGWNAQASTATTSNQIVLGNSAHTGMLIPGLGLTVTKPLAPLWTFGAAIDVTGNLATDVLKSYSANIIFANAGGTTMGTWAGATGILTMAFGFYTVASSTVGAGLRLPHGAAPTSPGDGDCWTTTGGLFVRINGVTKSVNLT